jgi:predicted molibdopterin-dependent oxidoreductase YjgC
MNMRITQSTNEIPEVKRGRRIEVMVNNRKVEAFEGELVSTVLQAEGISIFGRKHDTGRPSGIYCGMGVCYECLVTVNGTPNTRACQTFVTDQMVIETADWGEA